MIMRVRIIMNCIRDSIMSWTSMNKMLIAIAVLSLFISQQTAAQRKITAEGLSKLSFEELLQVRITGSTLTPKELKTVPSAVTVFTHEEIERMGLETLDELMNLVPGFQSYRSSASAMHYPFSSRGRRIGSASAEILLLVDGQRLDEPRTSGSAIILSKVRLEHIERVEFIRGPGGAVYGSNAMMGVINIITRTGANELSAGYGSFSRRKAYLLASRVIGDVEVDLFGHIQADDGDGYWVKDTYGPGNINTDDPRELADLNVKLRWKNTQLNFQHHQFELENFYAVGKLSNQYNSRETQLSSISLKQSFDWRSVASYVWLSYRRSTIIAGTQLSPPGALADISDPPSDDPLHIITDFDDYSETRAQWHNDWDINDQSSLQLGLELRHINAPEAITRNNFDLRDYVNRDFPIRYYGDLRPTTPLQTASKRDIVGLYGQYQRRLFGKTRLTLGLRYDDFSGIGSRLSPRLGLVQELSGFHSLKLLYGEAFRAPAEWELNLVNNPIVLGNPDLKPETVQSFDLIWMGTWSHTGVSLGYFENHFKNSIVQTGSGGGLLQYENGNQDPTKGFEFELSHELNEHWLWRTTYTHFSEKPDISFRETDRLASLLVNYQRGKWNANLIATYHGEREMSTDNSDSTRITLDSDWLLFGKLLYNITSDWQAFVQGKNLLDEDNLSPPINAVLTEGIPDRGRELLVGIIWHR